MNQTITLTSSEVIFDKADHKYYLHDKELKGVTSTLIRKAFPDTYKDIPQYVLDRAAERGGLIHNQLEIFNSCFDSDIRHYPSPTPEIQAYSDFLHSYGLHHVASEYLVSDLEHFASSIDEVLADTEGNIYLVDYKTTSVLHYDNVSLQLSIYAQWFEQQNPDLHVKEIVCMWFKNDKSKFQPLPRVSAEKIEALIQAYLTDDPEYHYEVEIPEQFSSLEQEYRLLTARIDALTLRQSDIKQQLLNLMQANNQKSIKTPYGSYAYVAASTTKRFDSKLFKDTEPDHYEHYLREVESKPQIRIKLNN